MEFLTTFEVTFPDGASDRRSPTSRRAKPIGRASSPSRDTSLRLWRLPPKAGSWLALGLWQARDGEELQAILESLPMDKWMTTETTPLTEHPNDPAKAEV